MFASPAGLPELDFAQEKARLEQATASLRQRGLMEWTWLEGQGWRDLQTALWKEGPWHVFHFIGHGRYDAASGEGQLALADERRQVEPLGATALARLLSNHKALRLAFLNACEGAQVGTGDPFSSLATALVRRGLPAVVAMQYEITDRAAVELGRVFYELLAAGQPVDAALSEARVAISLAVANSLEWGTPVLYLRAPDGVLFSRQETVDGRRGEDPKGFSKPFGSGNRRRPV
jgi:CHAT domain-containing protein